MAQTNGQEVISYRKRQIFGTKNLLFEKLLLRILEAEKSHLDLKQYKKNAPRTTIDEICNSHS